MPNSTLQTRRTLGVVLTVCACLTSACATAQPTSGLTSISAPKGALAKFYTQEVNWEPCPAEEVSPYRAEDAPPPQFECATITVPLDYQNPGGDTITVALNRLPATDPDRRIGSLLTNPGGPGESGLALVYAGEQFFTPELRARYDIIGMDPRGVGKSTPVQCQTQEEVVQTDQQYPEDLEAQAKAFVADCKAHSGRLLPHVGTDSVIRDMDVVRTLLGEKKLNYLGFSYGTMLGLFYAQQFPENVGRMVLDSVVDPADWPGDPHSEVVPFETTLGVFVETCTSQPDCPMGDDRAQVQEQIDELVEQVATNPLPSGPGLPPVDAGTLLGVLSSAMYTEKAWPRLAEALAAAFGGDGFLLADLATAGGGGSDGDLGSFEAVACLHERPEDRTEAAATVGAEEALTVAPIFGPAYAGTAFRCANWPVPSLPQAGRTVTGGEDIPPILLVNNLFDPATQISWARDVHGQLPNSVLVTNTAGGHGFYDMGECTQGVVDGYLLTGKMPDEGTVCQDRAPELASAWDS